VACGVIDHVNYKATQVRIRHQIQSSISLENILKYFIPGVYSQASFLSLDAIIDD
jgi:hypothetical protein